MTFVRYTDAERDLIRNMSPEDARSWAIHRLARRTEEIGDPLAQRWAVQGRRVVLPLPEGVDDETLLLCRSEAMATHLVEIHNGWLSRSR